MQTTNLFALLLYLASYLLTADAWPLQHSSSSPRPAATIASSPIRIAQSLLRHQDRDKPFHLETFPLIGGPPWLPLHVKVIVHVLDEEDNKSTVAFDFVPVDATNPATLQSLLQLQSVPGCVRTTRRPPMDCHSNDGGGTFNETRLQLSTSTTSDAAAAASTINNYLNVAQSFCSAYKTNLHLLDNTSNTSDAAAASTTNNYLNVAKSFCLAYKTNLHLLDNNCWSFALALLNELEQAHMN
ncbi:hypothetical protein MPSEU_000201300 [Mayamaea pseudoterrestris]|nr:hypothetical protein MPSEU_000201300 [Mayamaea pseudoterrestris]